MMKRKLAFPTVLVAIVIGGFAMMKSPAPVADGVAMEQLSAAVAVDLDAGLKARNAQILAYIDQREVQTQNRAAAGRANPEDQSLNEIASHVRCQLDATLCSQKASAEEMRQSLEHLEAQLRLNGLKNEAAAGQVLLALIESSEAYAKTAIQLLQEFENATSLLAAFDIPRLAPETKIELVEASLDPADESLKAELRIRARGLVENMFIGGSTADAYQAAAALKHFPEMQEADLVKIGRGLCRFKSGTAVDETEEFKYEALKLRLERSIHNRKQLKTLISTCEG